MPPTALIIRTAGTNCDRELAHAFELAGAATHTVHLNQLIVDPAPLAECDLLGLPGGFSYGDDIAAGRIFAHRLKHHLLTPLLAAIDRGVPMIAPCNGFQVLVKLGLLPDPREGKQSATLTDNAGGRFIDRWVAVEADPASPCIWTRGLDRFDLPIAHAEGRFVTDQVTLEHLAERGQIALRYADENPNGSMDRVAGICDPTGLVLGLMPHPERDVHRAHHPQWTRKQYNDAATDTPPGLRFFQNAVAHVEAASVAMS